MNEPGDLIFRERPGRRKPRPHRSSSIPWLLIAVVAAILFVFAIRALLERTRGTAGESPAQATQVNDAPPPAQTSKYASYTEARPVPMVYRCVNGAGAVSLQSQPCARGQRTTRAIPAPPEREPIRPRQYARPAPSNRQAYNTAYVPQYDQRAARRAACAAARQQRADTLERVGLQRTYDLLQRLDAVVNEACKGL